ncbi:MAG: hypothetical protein Q8P50_11200 [Bacillota bacterium]|jgi:hypothetical protein|nr:hypothetical protein [Bacillota bacterium]
MQRPFFSAIWKPVGEAIADYALIDDGDVIGAGVPGGNKLRAGLKSLWKRP